MPRIRACKGTVIIDAVLFSNMGSIEIIKGCFSGTSILFVDKPQNRRVITLLNVVPP